MAVSRIEVCTTDAGFVHGSAVPDGNAVSWFELCMSDTDFVKYWDAHDRQAEFKFAMCMPDTDFVHRGNTGDGQKPAVWTDEPLASHTAGVPSKATSQTLVPDDENGGRKV